MAELQVDLLGHAFKNPVVAASGVYGYGQEYEAFFPLSALGGFVSKATTLRKRTGNDGTRITEIPGGVLFSVGLQNAGVDAYIREHLPRLLQKGTHILTNVAGSDADEYAAVVEKLEQTDAPILELNISCPNVAMGGASISTDAKATRAVTARIRAMTKKPLAVKLAPNVTDVGEIAKAAQDGGADAISLINSMPGMKIDLNSRRPLFRNNTGGMSGRALLPLAVRLVWQVSRAVQIPILGLGGVTTGEDALELMMAGATAVQMGAAALRDPRAPVRVIEEMNRWLDRNHVARVQEIIGSVRPW